MSNFNFGKFTWWMGIVKNVTDDPLEAGRIQVKVYGYYTDLEDSSLPWAQCLLGTDSAGTEGYGTTPSGLLPGSTVFGFFADGGDAQYPVVVGVLPGVPHEAGKRYDANEADVHRLARNKKTDTTQLNQRKTNLKEAVGAFGKSWKEKISQYAAKYPFNKVMETISGHLFERDDTPGAERLFKQHKAGTFEEIHPDGTIVTKVVKDRYSIVLGDDYVLVDGSCNIVVMNDAHLRVAGNLNYQVDGNIKVKVAGNYDVTVDGNYTKTITGNDSTNAKNIKSIASANHTLKGKRIDVN